MEDILGFWDKLHQKFVQDILKVLLDKEKKNEVRVAKIKYTLTYVVGEMEKIIALAFVFFLLGMVKEFFIAVISLVSLRIFMGGTHRSTMLTCFLQALITFAIICGLGSVVNIYPYCVAIYVFLAILIWISTPIVSEKRIHYSKAQCMVFKARALTVLLFISLLCDCVNKRIGNYILWAISIQGIEVAGIILLGRRRMLCEKN